jgi:hypothetical protein
MTARNRQPLRILVTIPHFYGEHGKAMGSSTDTRVGRATTVARTITSVHEQLGPVYEVFPWHRQPLTPISTVDVVVVTSGDAHLVADLEAVAPLFRHEATDVAPELVPFECQRVLREAADRYDVFVYLEDDMLVVDPLLAVKCQWFAERFGDDTLLMPNRYERKGGAKFYPDGPLDPAETAEFQDITDRAELRASALGIDVVFRRPSNPHAGMYVLTRAQFSRWAAKPYFGVPSADFIDTMESGATLGLIRTFRVYKPAEPTADFLEVEHGTHHYLDRWAIPGPLYTVSAAYLHAAASRTAAQSAYDSLLRSPTLRLTAPVRNAVRRLRPRRRPL